MHPTKSKLAFAAMFAAGALPLGGCATKGYVDEQVASVNQRIDGVDSRLSTVEGTANNALTTAQAASAQSQQNRRKSTSSTDG